MADKSDMFDKLTAGQKTLLRQAIERLAWTVEDAGLCNTQDFKRYIDDGLCQIMDDSEEAESLYWTLNHFLEGKIID